MRKTTVTYKELGLTVEIEGVGLAHHLPKVLNEVSARCEAQGEPSLAALVVNADTGAPGSGWTDGAVPWHTEIRRLYDYWSK
jgi:hypothetical protein